MFDRLRKRMSKKRWCKKIMGYRCDECPYHLFVFNSKNITLRLLCFYDKEGETDE